MGDIKEDHSLRSLSKVVASHGSTGTWRSNQSRLPHPPGSQWPQKQTITELKAYGGDLDSNAW